MIKHSEKRHSKYSSDQMFKLVADVESYPMFIPWCRSVNILSSIENQEDRCEMLEVDMRVSFKVFSETFRSKVLLNRQSNEIKVDYITGPFKFLNNIWDFADCNHGCIINFYVEFEFKSKMMQRLIGIVFNEAMRRIVISFEKRADQLYK